MPTLNEIHAELLAKLDSAKLSSDAELAEKIEKAKISHLRGRENGKLEKAKAALASFVEAFPSYAAKPT